MLVGGWLHNSRIYLPGLVLGLSVDARAPSSSAICCLIISLIWFAIGDERSFFATCWSVVLTELEPAMCAPELCGSSDEAKAGVSVGHAVDIILGGSSVGDLEGLAVGVIVGHLVGSSVGDCEGCPVGKAVWRFIIASRSCAALGNHDGVRDGRSDGTSVSAAVGPSVGENVGCVVGCGLTWD